MGEHSGQSCRLSALTTDAGVEMPVYGKPGKNDNTVFPTLPTDLGNRYCRFPHSHATTTTRMNISSNPPTMGYAFCGQGQLHRLHASGIPQKTRPLTAPNLPRHPRRNLLVRETTAWRGGLLLLRHITPLTRRHVVYFCSGAYVFFHSLKL